MTEGDRDESAGRSLRERQPVRQRRQQGGRPHKHSVRMSQEEQAVVEARAGQAGVSVPRFLVEAGLAGDAATASQLRANAAELLAARRLVAAVGVNLNQLAKVANATGEVPSGVGGDDGRDAAVFEPAGRGGRRLRGVRPAVRPSRRGRGRRPGHRGRAGPGARPRWGPGPVNNFISARRGSSPGGLVRYLFGPGSSQEHTDQRIIAADVTLGLAEGTRLDHLVDAEAIYALGRDMDSHRILLGVAPPGGWVWHCAISLPPEESLQGRRLGDEQWADIARTAISRMGFDEAVGRAPCRWIAVHHGRSVGGNDHIHLMVNLVREDGTLASTWNDRRTMSRVCADMERRYGLAAVEGRTGRGMPGYSKAEHQRMRAGQVPERQRIARLVRSCALISADEAEFVRRARRSGLSVRARYSKNSQEVVGYSVALRGQAKDGQDRPEMKDRRVWFGGGRLAADLSCRGCASTGAPTAESAAKALAQWRREADVATPRKPTSGPPMGPRRGARPSPGSTPSPPSSAAVGSRTWRCGRARPGTPPR
ncbi:relaxase/mobilization nuclease domain-containing protein [Streptosporangium lutulentum]